MAGKKPLPLWLKKTLWILLWVFIGLVVAAGLAFGGWKLYRYIVTRPANPGDANIYLLEGRVSAVQGDVLRMDLTAIKPSLAFADYGTTVIVKTDDTKLDLVRAGDLIQLKCRNTYLPVPGARKAPVISKITWELADCRLATSAVGR